MSKNITNTTSNTSANKAIIWTKVSALEQRRGLSLQAQITDTQQYCHNKGFEVLKEYSDTEGGRASKTLKYKEMIKFIKQQTEPVNIITQSLERLYRDIKSCTDISKLKDEGKIIIHCTKYNEIVSRDNESFHAKICLILASHKRPYKPRQQKVQQTIVNSNEPISTQL
jgi:DNA invertase Pin-like site-specific DNA recombinase